MIRIKNYKPDEPGFIWAGDNFGRMSASPAFRSPTGTCKLLGQPTTVVINISQLFLVAADK